MNHMDTSFGYVINHTTDAYNTFGDAAQKQVPKEVEPLLKDSHSDYYRFMYHLYELSREEAVICYVEKRVAERINSCDSEEDCFYKMINKTLTYIGLAVDRALEDRVEKLLAENKYCIMYAYEFYQFCRDIFRMSYILQDGEEPHTLTDAERGAWS